MGGIASNADGKHLTYCRICEALCGLSATVSGGKIVHIGPDRDHVTSNGHLCVKGPAMMYVAYDPDRVLKPLKRTGGPGQFESVTWDEALDDISRRILAITDEHGGDSLGLYFGNPASFAFRHMAWSMDFLREFQSSKIYTPVHVDTGAKALGCALVYGPIHPYTFPDLENCDFLLMLGANPLVSHMSLITEPRALQRLEAIAARGGVVVVDPRRTETAQRFEHLSIPPDSDVWLLAGVLRTLFDERRFDEPRLDKHIRGWRSLRAALERLDLEACGQRCRTGVDDIRTLARRFADARTAACYGRIGTNRGTFPTLTNVFIEAINLINGRFGQTGGWLTRASPFAQTQRSIFTPPSEPRRSRIGDFPLIGPFQPGGGLADDILTPGEGKLRALLVDSGNPVLAYPNGHKLEGALDKLDLLVSLDFYVNETTKYSHYILPTPTFLERADVNDAFITRAPRPWLQYTDAVIEPQGESRLELEIYNALLTRTGRTPIYTPAREGESAETALTGMIDELLANTSAGVGVGALSVERMRADFPSGLRLDDAVDAEATWSRITHADGKACLWDEVIEAEFARLREKTAEAADPRLRLFGRRLLRSINSWMHNDRRMVRSDTPRLLMHPNDALVRQIRAGQAVTVTSDFGEIEVDVELSDEVIEGSVSYPHGWGHAGGWRVANGLAGRNVNELASSDPKDWEQVSGMCMIDGIPVDVRAISP